MTILTVKSLSLKKLTSPGQGHTHSVRVGSGIQTQIHLPLNPYSQTRLMLPPKCVPPNKCYSTRTTTVTARNTLSSQGSLSGPLSVNGSYSLHQI